MLPSLVRPPEATHRVDVHERLKQMGYGLQDYHDLHETLPPGVVTSESGEYLHGWHAQLLPYIEQQALYDQIDISVPWRHNTNRAAMMTSVQAFLNPRRHWRLGKAPEQVDGYAATHYASNALVLGGTRPMKFSDVRDGLSNTVFGGEAAGAYRSWGDSIGWRDPKLGLGRSIHGFGGADGKTALILLGDGSVRVIPHKVSPRVWDALCTPAGREEIPNNLGIKD